MSPTRVSLGNSLSAHQAAVVKAKLRNMDGISVVPIAVSGDSIVIGFDPWDTEQYDWERILQNVGYRVHSV